MIHLFPFIFSITIFRHEGNKDINQSEAIHIATVWERGWGDMQVGNIPRKPLKVRKLIQQMLYILCSVLSTNIFDCIICCTSWCNHDNKTYFTFVSMTDLSFLDLDHYRSLYTIIYICYPYSCKINQNHILNARIETPSGVRRHVPPGAVSRPPV